MHVRRRVSIPAGIFLVVAGVWLARSSGNQWTVPSTAGVLAFIAGAAVVWVALAFPPFDADLDHRLREGVSEGPALAGWVQQRGRLPQQCVVHADGNGLTVITASRSVTTEWSAVTRIRGGLGGPGRPSVIVAFRTRRYLQSGYWLRFADQSALGELAAVTPAGVRWRVRTWRYTPLLAVARWSLVVLTSLWALTFAFVMIAAQTWLLPLSALAAVATLWGSWTAWRIRRPGYATVGSAFWLSAVGLWPALTLAMPTHRQTLLGGVVGTVLTLADLTVLVATLAGVMTMPKLTTGTPAADAAG